MQGGTFLAPFLLCDNFPTKGGVNKAVDLSLVGMSTRFV